MLIFFLVAGTVAPPMDPDLTLPTAADLEGRAPPDALVLRADGTLLFRGEPAEPVSWMAAQLTDDVADARIVPDRDVPAARLMEIAQDLRAAGAERVLVVAERGLE
ncbi:ExbD/TolR family protein [Jannaschia sp. 2305UL9-9]|uniref:ExbD/TolR family protein n=1 Tax=Jannaschia sp. 2305UL9-9 TaxID=3121638 RepID=UPI0035275E2A